MNDIHEAFNDPTVNESLAASNLAELLDKLTYARSEQPLHENLLISVTWTGGVAASRQPGELFRQYLNRRLTHMLPTFRKDWLDSLEKDVAAARENLAEIQARK